MGGTLIDLLLVLKMFEHRKSLVVLVFRQYLFDSIEMSLIDFAVQKK